MQVNANSLLIERTCGWRPVRTRGSNSFEDQWKQVETNNWVEGQRLLQ